MYIKVFDLAEKTGIYNLLYGKVQSGKSVAAQIIMWMAIYKHNIRPIFITKKLGSIREDIIMKLNEGFLNDIINKCGQKFEMDESEIKKYIPKPIEYEEIKGNNTIEKQHIPVFLMQNHNFEQLVSYQNKIEESGQFSVFIIDEIHEMYSSQTTHTKNKGLKDDGKKSNFGFLHWIKKKKEEHKSQLIGITATPYRIFADLYFRPDGSVEDNGGVHCLNSDPPISDAIYVGYNNDNSYNFNINEYNNDNIYGIIDIVNDRPKIDEIPFILITSEFKNSEQDNLCENINKYCEDNNINAYIRTFHQKTKNREFNCDTLFRYFDKIPDDIYKSGLLIMVGDKRLDTGVTIKPEFNQKCTRYGKTINGITDQVNGSFKCLEANMQKSRFFGWYKRGHIANLWVPYGEIEIYKCAIPEVHNSIIRSYNGEIIREIYTPISKMNHITAMDKNDMYEVIVDGRNKKCIVKEISTIPEDIPILKSKFFQIQLPNQLNKTLRDNKGGNNKLFSPVLKEINTIYKIPHGIHRLQIAWSNERCKQIQNAIFEPSNDSRWQVNSFIYGDNFDNTPINSCTLVVFEKSWEIREQIKDHDQLCVQIGENKWLLAKSISTAQKTMEHKFSDQSNDLTEEHHKVISKIDHLWELVKSGITKINSWILFMKVRKSLNKQGGGSPQSCSPEYKKDPTKNKFEEITKSGLPLDQMI